MAEDNFDSCATPGPPESPKKSSWDDAAEGVGYMSVVMISLLFLMFSIDFCRDWYERGKSDSAAIQELLSRPPVTVKEVRYEPMTRCGYVDIPPSPDGWVWKPNGIPGYEGIAGWYKPPVVTK